MAGDALDPDAEKPPTPLGQAAASDALREDADALYLRAGEPALTPEQAAGYTRIATEIGKGLIGKVIGSKEGVLQTGGAAATGFLIAEVPLASTVALAGSMAYGLYKGTGLVADGLYHGTKMILTGRAGEIPVEVKDYYDSVTGTVKSGLKAMESVYANDANDPNLPGAKAHLNSMGEELVSPISALLAGGASGAITRGELGSAAASGAGEIASTVKGTVAATVRSLRLEPAYVSGVASKNASTEIAHPAIPSTALAIEQTAMFSKPAPSAEDKNKGIGSKFTPGKDSDQSIYERGTTSPLPDDDVGTSTLFDRTTTVDGLRVQQVVIHPEYGRIYSNRRGVEGTGTATQIQQTPDGTTVRLFDRPTTIDGHSVEIFQLNANGSKTYYNSRGAGGPGTAEAITHTPDGIVIKAFDHPTKVDGFNTQQLEIYSDRTVYFNDAGLEGPGTAYKIEKYPDGTVYREFPKPTEVDGFKAVSVTALPDVPVKVYELTDGRFVGVNTGTGEITAGSSYFRPGETTWRNTPPSALQ